MLSQVDIGNTFGSPFGVNLGLSDLVSIILSNAVSIAGFILFVLIVVGGFLYIAGAGNSDPQKTAQGKSAITTAVIGFIIIFVTYWIIQLVEIIFGINILNANIS